MRAPIGRLLTLRALPLRVLSLLTLLGPSCAPDGLDAGEPEGTVTDEIVNGDQVTDSRTNPGAAAVYHQHLVNGSMTWMTRPCSGVAISRTYVMTALHCVTTGEEIDRTRLVSSSALRMTNPDNVIPGAPPPSTGFTTAREII